MLFKKLMIVLLLAGATVLPVTSANAFWGGNSWMPWNWFDDDDYYGGPWGGYPGWGGPWGGYPGYYGGYPGYGYGGYPGYYGGYPGYGYGGYPGYGYGGYPGGWW